MNSRRKFLRDGSLATSVLFATKPFELMAKTVSPFTKGNDANSIILLHTGNSSATHFSATASAAASAKKNLGNALLLNAPYAKKNAAVVHADLIAAGSYDAVLADMQQSIAGDTPLVLSNNPGNLSAGAEPVRIFYKGDIKIGVLGIAQPANSAVFSEINRLAKTLKEERNCHLVVCISSLGYENSNKSDDIHLAQNSTHLDVIISGNNSADLPSTVLANSLGAEVLVDNAGNRKSGIGKIEIKFNSKGQKNYVSFGSGGIA